MNPLSVSRAICRQMSVCAPVPWMICTRAPTASWTHWWNAGSLALVADNSVATTCEISCRDFRRIASVISLYDSERTRLLMNWTGFMVSTSESRTAYAPFSNSRSIGSEFFALALPTS